MLIKPRHDQRWDGAHKNSAKECLNCNYHILIEEHDLCGVGEAFKYLIRTENPRKCGEIKKEFENPSIHYLREVAKNPEDYRISTHTQGNLF